jgi:uncharacterized protein YgiM (DUF1202 family)
LRDVTSVTSSSGFTLAALIFLAIALMAAALFFFKMRSMAMMATFIFFILITALTEALALAKYNIERQQDAIVMMPNTYVKSAPGTASADLFILHEGTKVMVLEQFEQWLKVKMPDGKIGWLPANDVAII